MSPAVVSFEVLRFEAVPAAAGVAVLELDGRFASAARRAESPRLLVEGPARSVELPAVEIVREPWSATFAVPLDAVADGETRFALVPARGPLIALPTPHVAGADDDRFVRLARTVNELRHRLTETTTAAGAAGEQHAAAVADRDRLAGELADARARIAELERRAEQGEQAARDAEAGREDAAADLAEAGTALSAARARVDELTERAEHAERTAREARTAADDAARAGDEARSAAAYAEQDALAARAELAAVRERIEGQQRERAAGLAAPAAAGGALRWDPGEPTEPTEPIAAAAAASPEPTQTFELDADDVAPAPSEDQPGRAVHLRPAGARPTGLTPARLLVGAAVLLLFAALVLIFLGVV